MHYLIFLRSDFITSTIPELVYPISINSNHSPATTTQFIKMFIINIALDIRNESIHGNNSLVNCVIKFSGNNNHGQVINTVLLLFI